METQKTMEYNFKTQRTMSKSFYMMIQLKQNILKGLNCLVATHNPEKTKIDFEYWTGDKLKLEQTDKSNDLFVASLIK